MYLSSLAIWGGICLNPEPLGLMMSYARPLDSHAEIVFSTWWNTLLIVSPKCWKHFPTTLFETSKARVYKKMPTFSKIDILLRDRNPYFVDNFLHNLTNKSASILKALTHRIELPFINYLIHISPVKEEVIQGSL